MFLVTINIMIVIVFLFLLVFVYLKTLHLANIPFLSTNSMLFYSPLQPSPLEKSIYNFNSAY